MITSSRTECRASGESFQEKMGCFMFCPHRQSIEISDVSGAEAKHAPTNDDKGIAIYS